MNESIRVMINDHPVVRPESNPFGREEDIQVVGEAVNEDALEKVETSSRM
jgi:hypothetical protein